jgi:hypothetical protein
MLPPDLLDHVSPTWIPFVPDASDLYSLLDKSIKSYLHFIPHPSKPVSQSFDDIQRCLQHLNVVPETLRQAKDLYLEKLPGLHLLFDRDIEVAALYAALLIKDFEKARTITSISKDKVLVFLEANDPKEALSRVIHERYPLPVVDNGIAMAYWKHMNVFDRDHEDVLLKLKTIHESTHYALSYLLDRCEISMGHTLQIGFKL